MMDCRGIRRGLGRGIRDLALCGLLTIWAALAAMPAAAFEPPPGSKNFTSPSSVPNYFSNETGPFDRGARVAQPSADRFNTASAPASGGYATSQATRSAAAAAQQIYREPARGRSGRHLASSPAGRAHARGARAGSAYARHSVKPASRHTGATKHRAAASRPRHAGQGAKAIRQASR